MALTLPPVTIAIPFYNAEATLLDAVRSVFAQTHQNWELILLDDGSTDNSLQLAHSIKDPRVKVYSDGENKKLAARLNEIPKLAKHDYLARMDADDLMSPTRIELQLTFLLNHTELDIVSTGVCSITDCNMPVGARCPNKDHSVTALRALKGRPGIVHASLMATKSWFLRNQYKENLKASEDTNLWVRAFSKKDLKVGFMHEPLYYYREDGNVTFSKLRTAYIEGLKTILIDSKTGYTIKNRVIAFSSIFTKLVLIGFLYISGNFEILRKRRNTSTLTTNEVDVFTNEIAYIRSIKLPI